jgi:hypothetical protein
MHAFSAADAEVLPVHQLETPALAFRIVTPPAPHTAPFEKNGCPYAGSVVQCKPLDGEDCSLKDANATVGFIITLD